ncbi:Thoeris anti-defense Tad2 family protein [Klebsiella pneumoniae]|uniref:Thoeris anti-defense Tad2 family protein n=1 Tax=Klebsiella pneumoniae TaxID=573 RepID=UPI003B5C0D04
MNIDYMSYEMATGAVRGGAEKIRRIGWTKETFVTAAPADDPSAAPLVLVTDGVESDYSPTEDDKSGDDWICF